MLLLVKILIAALILLIQFLFRKVNLSIQKSSFLNQNLTPLNNIYNAHELITRNYLTS